MNDHIFSLYMEVINAATSGRYCHGNSVHWCIVDEHGNDVVINTFTGITTVQLVPNPVKPHVHMKLARSLEQYLMNTKADEVFTGVSTSDDAIRYAAQHTLWAFENDAICHFNGAQCFIEHRNIVHVYNFSIPGEVTSTTMGKMASWQYLRANSNARQNVSRETFSFLEKYSF